MLIKRKSVISGIEHAREIPVNPEDLERWEKGYGSIRDLMSYLSVEDRTFIMSGITDQELRDAFREKA